MNLRQAVQRCGQQPLRVIGRGAVDRLRQALIAKILLDQDEAIERQDLWRRSAFSAKLLEHARLQRRQLRAVPARAVDHAAVLQDQAACIATLAAGILRALDLGAQQPLAGSEEATMIAGSHDCVSNSKCSGGRRAPILL
jgi:hypothetical protein